MNRHYPFLVFPALILACSSALADVTGSYTTVSESACNEELVLLPDMTGKLINTCRLEDGSNQDEVREVSVTWMVEGAVIAVSAGPDVYTFRVEDSLSCSPFGGAGSSPGLIGRGSSYWKRPISC